MNRREYMRSNKFLQLLRSTKQSMARLSFDRSNSSYNLSFQEFVHVTLKLTETSRNRRDVKGLCFLPSDKNNNRALCASSISLRMQT